MSNKVLTVIIVILILAFGGFFVYRMKSQNSPSGISDKQNQQTSQEAQKDAAQQTKTCQRNFNQETLKTAQVNIKNRTVELDIKDFGSIQIQLYDKDAPKTVENFLRLVNAGYYDCLTFHRVAKGFVIQGGDPTGTGSGGDSAFGGPFADELNPNTPSYKSGYLKGVVAMANSGPNTNTSQFFIMLADVPLSHNYTIFGKVIQGQDVVDKIGQVEITPQLGPTDGKPVVPVIIEKATIVK